jgi:hypothetical protein
MSFLIDLKKAMSAMAEAAREAVAKVRIEPFCIAAEDHGCIG